MQLSNDANAEAWREYDSEDAEAYEAGRIRPDEHTVRGEVVDTPTPGQHQGSSPLDFDDSQAPLGSTEYEQAPYAAGRGGDGPMTTEQRIRAGSVDARNDRGQRPVDIAREIVEDLTAALAEFEAVAAALEAAVGEA